MRTLKNWLVYALSVSVGLLLIVGCGELSAPKDEAETDVEAGETELLINEEEAMSIAMDGLDPAIYQATSTISGPMEYAGAEIYSYEVTVNGGDHLYLRYVDTST